MVRDDRLTQAARVDVEQDAETARDRPERQCNPEPAHPGEHDLCRPHQHQRGHRERREAEALSQSPGKQACDDDTPGACSEERADAARADVEPIVREQHELCERRCADEIDEGHHQRDVPQDRMADDIAQPFSDVVENRRGLLGLVAHDVEAATDQRQGQRGDDERGARETESA